VFVTRKTWNSVPDDENVTIAAYFSIYTRFTAGYRFNVLCIRGIKNDLYYKTNNKSLNQFHFRWIYSVKNIPKTIILIKQDLIQFNV